MDRRQFLELLLKAGAAGSSFALLGCGRSPTENIVLPRTARDGERALIYDTYAIALYFDGSQGPKTGIVTTSYLMADVPITLDFWHGHGGKLHQFTLLPEHFRLMKKLKKVTLETTSVDGHKHKLFVDTSDARFRVPGSEPIAFPDDENFQK